MEFQRAAEPEAIGQKLIEMFHEHLLGVRVDFVFNSEEMKAPGREILARARVISGLNAWLAGECVAGEPEPFFLIEFSFPAWQELGIEARIGLVDHELAHCDFNALGQITLKAHDIEEFSNIVKRHGAYLPDVAHFKEALEIGESRNEQTRRELIEQIINS